MSELGHNVNSRSSLLSNASWSASTLARRLRSGLWEGRLGSIAAYFAEAARVRPAIDPILKQAIESTPDGLCITDTNRRVIICNRQFAFMYGLSQNDIGPGVSLDDFAGHLPSIAMEMSSHRIAACFPSRDGGGSQRFHELPNGRYVSVSRHAMDDGQTIEVHRDVTDERWADDRANQSIQALLEKQYAIDQAVIVAITDVKGNIVYANDNLCDISGYSRDELLGHNHRILKSGIHSSEFFKEMYRCLASGKVWRGEICNRSKAGLLYWVDTVITPQLDSNGKPSSYMAIRVDITARKEAEARLLCAVTRDSLTGTLNRSALLDQLKTRTSIEGDRNPFSLCLIDLDGFKAVNDTFGHCTGDKLLQQVGSRLQKLAGARGIVARLGGDEFAIIRSGDQFSNRSEQKLGRRVVDGLAEPFRIDGNDLNISASVGIVMFPEHGSSSQDLVKKADLALYDVKASSRNGYRLYSPALLDAVEEEKALEKRLHIALENNEFELHYQPIIDVGTRSVRAAEALVRWRDPVEGLVPPVRFIGVAERTGFILQLSEWIIGRACQDAMAWPSYIQLAVNVSALEFKRSNLFDVVLQALLRSGLSPERLQIEVTETALLESHPGQLRTFRQLKDMGVALVLDDFGTGYSSAAYVIDFPFDKIKIDKSFVQGLPKRECGAVIASAIALAKGMDITITAEGIETELQFGILSSMGIDFAQGYLFGRPAPAGQFSRQLSLNLKDRALTDCPEPLQLDHIEYLKNAV